MLKRSLQFTFILFLLNTGLLRSQNTVGILYNDIQNSFDGYNLIFPHNQSNVFLLDNCGRLVHTWTDSLYLPGNTALIDPSGNLYKCVRTRINNNPVIPASGGAGGSIQKLDWNNNQLWFWSYNDSLVRLHHDIALMPNGNILAISWEYKTYQEAVDAGRDTSLLSDGHLLPDKIIEIQPIGTDSAAIVWEWKVWDHLIQDYDSTKANYGDPANHPERVDINYVDGAAADWLHSNALDYNPYLDEVVLSVPSLNEIWIIDHSTTTAQAAGHSGGLSGRGGDLVYRWGNPAVYRQGTAADQTLFFPHDIHWADMELSTSHPDFGKLVVFNNRVDGGTHSDAAIFTPIFDSYVWEYPMTGTTWGPTGFDWTYTNPDTALALSTGLGSVQRLQNGNTLICSGRNGYSYEVTNNGTIVWEYLTPLINGNPVAQGTVLPGLSNFTFKMKRYSPGYSGFSGHSLLPVGTIETDPDTNFCDSIYAAVLPIDPVAGGISIYPNPASGNVHIELAQQRPGTISIDVYDIRGRRVSGLFRGFIDSGSRSFTFSTKALAPGIYQVVVQADAYRSNTKLIIE